MSQNYSHLIYSCYFSNNENVMKQQSISKKLLHLRTKVLKGHIIFLMHYLPVFIYKYIRKWNTEHI